MDVVDILDYRNGAMIPTRRRVKESQLRGLMRITEEIVHCVMYVGFLGKDGDEIEGTAFWISVPMEGMEKHHLVIATAKHVIEGIPKEKEVRLRVNTRQREAHWIPTVRSGWLMSMENDVAIYVWQEERDGDLSDYHFYSLNKAMHADKKRVEKEVIGIGDEVFTTGLFALHSGRRRNHPIIRTGNIAAFPEDKVPTKLYGDIEAYLIELRSISGLSGSPVFVHLPRGSSIRPIRKETGPPSGSSLGRVAFSLGDTALLLGVMHGHFDLDEDKLDSAIKKDDVEKLNTGIGIVAPIDYVWDMLEGAAREILKQEAQREREKVITTMYSAGGISKERFLTTLK